ncbi:MAG: ROK family protein [Actinomycetes bacterium]
MSTRNVIGVDLGGTKILAGVVDEHGEVLETIERPTPTNSQTALLAGLVAAVEELRTPEIVAVGFGIPARINRRTGVAFGAVNVPIREVRFQAELEQRLGLPVGAENDAGTAALAEFVRGAGRGARDLVLLTLGTGVGGGIVLDGKLYRGWAELGHMVIVENGEPCQGSCTGRGHVESYCSGLAAERLAGRVLGPGATARDLVREEHPALQEIGRHLGTAIASLVNIFDPELVVVGGGFGVAAGDLLLDPAREVVRREALVPGGESVRLVPAQLGASAGLIGAGLVAFEALG